VKLSISYLFFTIRFALFWLLFFAAFRGIFLALAFRGYFLKHNHLLLPKNTHYTEIIDSWFAALPLDLSIIGYFLALHLLISLLQIWSPVSVQSALEQIRKIVQWSLIGVATLNCTANALIYTEWQTMLNQRAIEYLRHPAALFDSFSKVQALIVLVMVLGLTWLWGKICRRLVFKNEIVVASQPSEKLLGTLSLIVLFGVSGLAIRGGLGTMPINESVVYYSRNTVLNHAATNPVWHFMHTLIERRSDRNPFVKMDTNTAQSLVNQLYAQTPTAPTRLSTLPKPNVVVVMMESMTAQILASFGGEQGVATFLDSLTTKSLFFNQVYSTGYRTDQGLAALLSGYPAQPDQSVILLEDKMRSLPSLPKVFAENGYETHYFYGGALNFANMGAYLQHLGFDHIVSEKQFSGSIPRQNWGVPDHLLFEHAIEHLKSVQQPFFGFVQTLSLHLPYDVPGKQLPNEVTNAEKFRHAARYADASIRAFMAAAQQQPWYENTLFVFVADHGHTEPQNHGMDIPMARKVPFIVTGAPLSQAFVGKNSAQLHNHHDLPATLISGLGLELGQIKFKWSRDMTSAYQLPFATYSNETGMGWLTQNTAGYHRFTDGFWYPLAGAKFPDSTARVQADAWLQALYDDFLKLDAK
jgi:phosphoglycerol transferase MdoB-like AlkP superfamily enzyme